MKRLCQERKDLLSIRIRNSLDSIRKRVRMRRRWRMMNLMKSSIPLVTMAEVDSEEEEAEVGETLTQSIEVAEAEEISTLSIEEEVVKAGVTLILSEEEVTLIPSVEEVAKVGEIPLLKERISLKVKISIRVISTKVTLIRGRISIEKKRNQILGQHPKIELRRRWRRK